MTLDEIIIEKKGGVAKLNHINGNRVASVGEKVKRFRVHISKDRVGGSPLTRILRTPRRPVLVQNFSKFKRTIGFKGSNRVEKYSPKVYHVTSNFT